MTIYERMTKELEARKDRSAWNKGVTLYAFELVEELKERAEYEACFDDDNQIEYFIEIGADDYSECYIDDDFVMYEDVAYTKKYA